MLHIPLPFATCHLTVRAPRSRPHHALAHECSLGNKGAAEAQFTLYLYDPIRRFLSLFHTLHTLSTLLPLSHLLIYLPLPSPHLSSLFLSYPLIVLPVTPSIATPGMYPPTNDDRCLASPSPPSPHSSFSLIYYHLPRAVVACVPLYYSALDVSSHYDYSWHARTNGDRGRLSVGLSLLLLCSHCPRRRRRARQKGPYYASYKVAQ
ncbi:hypothetical protein C8Q73DRAFT_259016 [Cubamyces lactineus]|nr:hypothetical protein C8Q73DRAFT_259016 [Cubamyces lactineus]